MSLHPFNNSTVTLPAFSGIDSIFTDHFNTTSTSSLVQNTPILSEAVARNQNNSHVHFEQSRPIGMTQQTFAQRQQYEQQIQSLHNTVAQLQAENAVLLASRNSYQDAFQRLVGALHLDPGNPENIPDTPTPMIVLQACRTSSSQRSLSGLREEDFPLVRFWTQSKYKEWLKTPERLAPEYKDVAYLFLEDDKGKLLDKDSVTNITKKMYAIWQGFKFRGVAPITWGIATDSVKQEFYTEVVREHAVLALCANNWKIEKIATDRYPSWKQTHLKDLEPGTKNSKRQVKKEERSVEDGHGKKRIKIDPAFSSSEEMSTPSVVSSDSENLAESSSSVPGSSDVEPIDTGMNPPLDTEPVPTTTDPNSSPSDAEQDNSVKNTSLINNNPYSGSISESLHTLIKEPALSVSAITNHDKPMSSVEQTTETAPLNTTNPVSVPLKNPLEKLLKKRTVEKITLPADAQPKTPPIPATVKPNQSKTTPKPEPSNNAAAASETSKSNGWEPRGVRTGRTLCAYRWLKQVNPNGNNNTFTTYWKSLSVDRKKQYEEECSNLVTTKTWIGFTPEIISMLSNGTMY